MKRVIDTLTEGFETVARHPWILLLPLLLDLFLWFGPQISLRPLVEDWLGYMSEVSSQLDDATLATVQQAWDEMGLSQIWEQFADRFNLFSVVPSVNIVTMLSLGLLDLPSLVAIEHLQGPLPNEGAALVEIQGAGAAIGLFGALVLLGFVLIATYQSLIAHLVREESVDFEYLATHLPRQLLHLLVAIVIIAGALLIVGGPLALVLFFAGVVSPTLMQILMIALGAILLWISLYIMLVPHGILVAEEKPLQAIWTSMNIVHKDFWGLLILLVLTRLVRTGFGYLWPRLTGSAPGMAIAILGNAFLGAGLAAATLCFFRDSYVTWREHLAQLAEQAQTAAPPTEE